MSYVGLAISSAYETDTSAYSHRVRKLAECLEKKSIRCDLFHVPNRLPFDIETAASFFMPFRLRTLRKYDFIYCGAEEAGQTLFFCRPFLRVPVILDLHGDVIAQSALANEIRSSGRNRRSSARVRLLQRMAMASADHWLTVTGYQTADLVREGYPAKAISLVRNGVDLKLFQPLPQPDEPKFMFAYVGEFQVWQGIENLISAFERLKDKSLRMLVIVFRLLDAAVKKCFRERFGARVELVDRTDRTTMMELLKSVAILIIPRIRHQAIRNAFPTKFAEYAAMGRPIMVNDVDETADFIRNFDCGFVSQPLPEVMAEAMANAALTPAQELAQMGARARQVAETNFSWDGIGEQYAQIVQKVTSSFQGIGTQMKRGRQ
jgi:glycosyltransferase involved in cell wall biosynthesis